MADSQEQDNPEEGLPPEPEELDHRLRPVFVYSAEERLRRGLLILPPGALDETDDPEEVRDQGDPSSP